MPDAGAFARMAGTPASAGVNSGIEAAEAEEPPFAKASASAKASADESGGGQMGERFPKLPLHQPSR